MIKHTRTIKITEPDTDEDGNWNLSKFEYRHRVLASRHTIVAEAQWSQHEFRTAVFTTTRNGYMQWGHSLPEVSSSIDQLLTMDRDFSIDAIVMIGVWKGTFSLSDDETKTKNLLALIGTTIEDGTTRRIDEFVENWIPERRGIWMPIQGSFVPVNYRSRERYGIITNLNYS